MFALLQTIEIFNNTFITRQPCQVSFNMILCIIPNIRSYMYFFGITQAIVYESIESYWK